MSKLRVAFLATAAGVALAFVPTSATQPFRAALRDALRPGQLAAQVAWQWSARAIERLPGSGSGLEESRRLRDALAAARLQNRRLQIRAARLEELLRTGAADRGAPPGAQSRAPLLVPQLVEARVLGDETAALWRTRKLLGAGSASGVGESALVLDDERPLVDQGADALLAPGDAVYSGRVVVGKIAEVGRYSSTLRLVTDAGYSGRARVARRTSRGLVFGAEGTLLGDGTELCRLKHITDPVNVGDEVYTGGTDGILPYPMYYGTIVAAGLEPGAREWTIRVKPAATVERLETVHVLRTALNDSRVLAN